MAWQVQAQPLSHGHLGDCCACPLTGTHHQLPQKMVQSLLYWLPNDILQDNFMPLLPQGDLAAICTSSKLLYHLANCALYQHIVLVKPLQLVRCCKTLMDTHFHVELVHKLCIDFPRFACIIVVYLLHSDSTNTKSNSSPPINGQTVNKHSKTPSLSEMPLH